MEKSSNLHDLQHKISLFFDNELCDSDKRDLLHKVNSDPHCSKIFNKEKNFREFIKKNVKRPEVSSDLIQSIRDRIRII